MLNLIGAAARRRGRAGRPRRALHLYGKEPRPGRKLGHVTLIDPSRTGSKRHWTRWEEAL